MKLNKKTISLWAKKRSISGVQSWLPLIVHMVDTKNTINFLYNNWLSEGVRKFLINSFHSEEQLHRFIKFLGFIHDIGKATPAFQKKKSYDSDSEMDIHLINMLENKGFTGLGEAYLSDPGKSPHTIAGEAILEYLGCSEAIGAIISGHHGKPVSKSNDPKDQLCTYTANYWQDDTDMNVQQPWKDVQRELMEYGLEVSGYLKVSELPQQIDQTSAILLEGLLIMADWLSSSEFIDNQRNIPLFPLISLDEGLEDIDIGKRYVCAMNNWVLDEAWIPEKIDDVNEIYKDYWGFEPRPVQKKISEELNKLNNPGIEIIEAPMGIGKTEAALVAAQQLAYKTGRDGVYIGLPTQATTNAMFERVNDWLKVIADNQEDNISIKLMHGKARFNKVYSSLPNAENIDDDGAVTVNSWFSGKKSILTRFMVGTIDNFLLLGLKQKHLFLRHLGFSGKVVIIDEVHAYDTYMDSYLYKSIEWLGAYHVPLIVLSATIPIEKRSKLVKSYLKGMNSNYKKLLQAPDNWDRTVAYPLLTMTDGSKIKQVSDFDNQSIRKQTVTINLINMDDVDLVNLILMKIENGGIVGIIVNTVRRAQSLAYTFSKFGVSFMVLHSAFLASDRSRIEDELQSKLGKHGDRPEKMVVIGTQVLEQSLDIDFDILFTDIAPMDLILQRIGRLHRHDRERPEKLKLPQTYIMGIEGDSYGAANEKIYSKYLLKKTATFLPTKVLIPTDISILVQKVYNPDTDKEINEFDEIRKNFDTLRCKATKKAEVFQISDPDYYRSSRHPTTIKGWLDKDHSDVSNDDQRAAAAVRDIQETIEVVLLQEKAGEFFLLDGSSLDEVSSEKIAQQLIRIPHVVTANVDASINELETITYNKFYDWQYDVWLKGSLALVLNEENETKLNGFILKYDDRYGLSYIKEGKDD